MALHWHSTYSKGNGKWLSCFLEGLENYLAFSAHLRVDFSKQVFSVSYRGLFFCQSSQALRRSRLPRESPPTQPPSPPLAL